MEAEKFEGRAEFAIKSAKTEADFLDAAKEYEKALLIAPWVPAYYFNQGIAFEKAGKLKEAKQSFETYLLAAPNAQDARDVRKRIAGLEYAIEKLAKESSPAAMAEKKRQEEGAFLKKIDGARYKYRYSDSRDEGDLIFDIRGDQVISGYFPTYSRFSPEGVGRYKRRDMAPLNGREFALPPSDGYWCGFLEHNVVEKGRISDDGESITTQLTTQKCIVTRTYRRER
jgi:tetratricopeptide (TPR) repeat protein